MFSFRNLEVYKRSRELVKEIYNLMDKFPKKEQFALSDQLRRAVISVPSNIAEGLSRRSTKEKLHFIEISYGSLMEVLCQCEIALDLKYIEIEEFLQMENQIQIISKLLSGLRKNLLTQLNPNPIH